jgi:hypothetical protein
MLDHLIQVDSDRSLVAAALRSSQSTRCLPPATNPISSCCDEGVTWSGSTLHATTTPSTVQHHARACTCKASTVIMLRCARSLHRVAIHVGT